MQYIFLCGEYHSLFLLFGSKLNFHAMRYENDIWRGCSQEEVAQKKSHNNQVHTRETEITLLVTHCDCNINIIFCCSFLFLHQKCIFNLLIAKNVIPYMCITSVKSDKLCYLAQFAAVPLANKTCWIDIGRKKCINFLCNMIVQKRVPSVSACNMFVCLLKHLFLKCPDKVNKNVGVCVSKMF